MNRPTIELILPDSKAKVCLYEFLTYGDSKKIQKKLLESVKISLKAGQAPGDVEMPDLTGTVAIENQEITRDILIKEVITADGNKIDNLEKFLYDLTIKDGQILEAKVTEISDNSSLTKEAKKK